MAPTSLDFPRFTPHAPVLGRMGCLETRLARNLSEIRAAQALRYHVFYQELGAKATHEIHKLGYEEDVFDTYCDHLLVVDCSDNKEKIVGTYRLLLPQGARAANGYYSQSEFDLTPLLKAHGQAHFLELGRSCILAQYRSKRVVELLWHGTWAYARAHKIDIMFGCASFNGVRAQTHQTAFSWLYHHAQLDSHETTKAANPSKAIDLKDFANHKVDFKRGFAALPPLLKGYLRVGAKTSAQAVIDHQFDTIDVFVMLKVANIAPRYLAHYGQQATRYAA